MPESSRPVIGNRTNFDIVLSHLKHDHEHGQNLTFSDDGSIESHVAGAVTILSTHLTFRDTGHERRSLFRKLVFGQTTAHLHDYEYDGRSDIGETARRLNELWTMERELDGRTQYGITYQALGSVLFPAIDADDTPMYVVDDDSFAKRMEQNLRLLSLFGALMDDVWSSGLTGGSSPRPYILIREGLNAATQATTAHAIFRFISDEMEDVAELSSERHKRVAEGRIGEFHDEDLDAIFLKSLLRVLELEAGDGNDMAPKVERLVRSFSLNRRFTLPGIIKAANIATEHVNNQQGGFFRPTSREREKGDDLPGVRRSLPEAASRLLQVAISAKYALSEQMQIANAFGFERYADRLIGVTSQKKTRPD